MKFTSMQNYQYWEILLPNPAKDDFTKMMLKERLNFRLRDKHISIRGFPVITTETFNTLIEIVKGGRVLDVGAGTGYLSYHLQKAGVNVTPIVEKKGRYGFKRNFFTKRIVKADCLEYDITDFDTFIFSWPCLDSDHAYKFLMRMKSGDKLIYQGEFKGDSCATDEFFDLLESDFLLHKESTYKLNETHLRFQGIRDGWEVWIKQ